MGGQDFGSVRIPRRVIDAKQAELATPGKATNSQTLPAASSGPVGATSNGMYASPGNLWSGSLKGPDTFKTGDDLADNGLGCAPVGANPLRGPCFLDPEQRRLVLQDYQLSVAAAHAEYLQALSDVRVEELIRKEPQQSEWMFDLLVDVISVVALSSLKNALRYYTSVHEITALAQEEQVMLDEIRAVTETQVTTLFDKGLSRARQVQKASQQATTPASNDKISAVTFLRMLGTEASKTFDMCKFSVPAGANDAELVVLRRTFEPSNGHIAAEYARQIREKLERFRKSGVANLGVQEPRRDLTHDLIMGFDEDRPESFVEVATAAFWVNTPAGRRLALYHRGHIPTPDFGQNDGRPVSVELTPTEREQYERDDLRRRPYQFLRYVPAEFVGAALQMNSARWGAEPEEHAMGAAEFQAMAWDR